MITADDFPLRQSILIILLTGVFVDCGNNGGDKHLTHDAGTNYSQDAGATSPCAKDCDDGFSCTIDTCTANGCTHLIGPNRDATACPSGYYCTLDDGCVAAPACATDAQCMEYWADDACKANVRCEAASSVCVFDILDKDRDGHAPPVCGGGDCNDADPLVHPEASESCNGVDDDCDGLVDEPSPAIDKQCGVTSVCESGSCVCKPENSCGVFCTDIQKNVDHCGGCGHSCGTNPGASSGWGSWRCTEGECTCSGDACDTVCTRLAEDAKNCGQCGHVCATNERCQNGACVPVHVCTKNSGTCDGDEFCRTTYPANNLGGIGVGCTTTMCDCSGSCGKVSDWEYECYPP